MLSAYRRFYLYSALSLSVLAAAVAITAALALVFRAIGLGQGPLTAEDTRLTLSQAAALLVFAIPIGFVHLRLITGALGDPVERSSNVRHFYLNLWIFASLVAVLFAATWLVQNIFIVFAQGNDKSIPVAALPVGSVVAVLGWRWRRATPAPPRWELVAAYATMIVAIVMAAFQVNVAAGAAGGLWVDPPRQIPVAAGRLEGELRWGLTGAAAALAVWAIAARWAWPHRTAVPRVRYLTFFYAIGIAALTMGAFIQIVALDAASYGRSFPTLGAAWPGFAIGVLLAGIHGAGLLLDRDRNGHPGIAMERILIAVPVLTGLAAAVIGLLALWSLAVDFAILPEHATGDARYRASDGIGPLVVGLVLYPISWWALLRRSDASSAVRRFVVFTIVCLALVGTVITGAVAVFNLFSLLTGALDQRGHRYDLVSWIGPTVLFAAIFAAYLLTYVRDQRAQRAAAPPAAAPAIDPLVVLFEDVAAGRLAPADAAARARALPIR